MSLPGSECEGSYVVCSQILSFASRYTILSGVDGGGALVCAEQTVIVVKAQIPTLNEFFIENGHLSLNRWKCCLLEIKRPPKGPTFIAAIVKCIRPVPILEIACQSNSARFKLIRAHYGTLYQQQLARQDFISQISKLKNFRRSYTIPRQEHRGRFVV